MVNNPILSYPTYIKQAKLDQLVIQLCSYNFTVYQCNIFAKHYENKASKTRSVCNTVLNMESMILPPWEAKKLYMAQIDPHLIHGYEVILDVDLPSLKSWFYIEGQ